MMSGARGDTGVPRREGEGRAAGQGPAAAGVRGAPAAWGQAYSQERRGRVVLVSDNAPGRRGEAVAEAPAGNPHLELYRLPPYRPKLNPIERSWEVLRRGVARNRLFDTPARLKAWVRNSLRYFQTVRGRVKQRINARPKKAR